MSGNSARSQAIFGFGRQCAFGRVLGDLLQLGEPIQQRAEVVHRGGDQLARGSVFVAHRRPRQPVAVAHEEPGIGGLVLAPDSAVHLEGQQIGHLSGEQAAQDRDVQVRHGHGFLR